MFNILHGSLAFDYTCNMMTDGHTWYKTIAPQLLYRLFNKKPTRPLIFGDAVVVGDTIIWFKKKRNVYRHYADK